MPFQPPWPCAELDYLCGFSLELQCLPGPGRRALGAQRPQPECASWSLHSARWSCFTCSRDVDRPLWHTAPVLALVGVPPWLSQAQAFPRKAWVLCGLPPTVFHTDHCQNLPPGRLLPTTQETEPRLPSMASGPPSVCPSALSLPAARLCLGCPSCHAEGQAALALLCSILPGPPCRAQPLAASGTQPCTPSPRRTSSAEHSPLPNAVSLGALGSTG